MKILLLEHPRTVCPERCNDIANTPLSSCLHSGYVAGMLISEGHEVEIIEGFLDGLDYQEIERRVKAMQPDLIGVHMVYHWQTDTALYAFLHKVKAEQLSSYITAYGYYPTTDFEDILLKCPDIDSVILGEPELTFTMVVEALTKDFTKTLTNQGLKNLPGLAQRDDSGIIVFQRRELVGDLNALPFPVRTEALFRLPEVNLQGSRGCYGGCTFCYINPFYGQGSQWRGRTPENIIAEIDDLIAQHKIEDFYFTDPNFFGPGERGQQRALRLATLLKSRNIRFGIEARVNDIHEETVSALVEAGLRHILIGLESGSDSSLKRINKMTTVAQNERAIRILRQYGIEPNIGFIMFEPDSSLADIRVNFEFLKRNDLINNLAITANMLYHHLIVLKGTKAHLDLQEAGRLEVQESTYESIVTLTDRKVVILAQIMRRITNFLFDRMAGIWGGKVLEPSNAKERYAQINGLLVTLFEDCLVTLESGEQFTEAQVETLVKITEEEIHGILG
ncbi:B12-binding domain-containing radical SAM protein [Desulfosporosinus sp. BICA1-9]|uniref:B12-binding domain-containing radical SAM protein n=1 Tax=Desulfosporosinus sp. BICA1-9 TaxID=1531958 RepID=UPI00054B0206|nr:radical SAM protein [Desulfosporosinus sp. BICA1-9]KJS90159.1 MAG: radical SAM protein [Desulfosporosinus sp. BICA1-9]HBW38929.1 B12-binding domain-containing radical SAM protein [Desulfosporosinus sp.]